MKEVSNTQIKGWKGEKVIYCERCGKAIRSNGKQKYCKECAKKMNIELTLDKYETSPIREFTCIDCGKNAKVDSRNAIKYRCDECQKKKDKEDTRKRVQDYRKRNV